MKCVEELKHFIYIKNVLYKLNINDPEKISSSKIFKSLYKIVYGKQHSRTMWYFMSVNKP